MITKTFFALFVICGGIIFLLLLIEGLFVLQTSFHNFDTAFNLQTIEHATGDKWIDKGTNNTTTDAFGWHSIAIDQLFFARDRILLSAFSLFILVIIPMILYGKEEA